MPYRITRRAAIAMETVLIVLSVLAVCSPSPAEIFSMGNQPLRSTDASLSKQEEETLHSRASMLFGRLPQTMPEADKDTPVQVDLGKKLYFETRISVNNTQSCNTCHPVQGKHSGVDNRPTSPGAQNQFGSRNAPTVLNAGFQAAEFWDGRSPDLADQAKGPILNPIEMGMPKAGEVLERLAAAGYKPLFAEAFPDQKDAFTYDNLGRAIAAFERTMVSRSRFDGYLEAKTADLQPLEKQGLTVFMNVACASCHGGPTLGGLIYQKIGVVHPYSDTKDKGRFDVTKQEVDQFVFKVPMLRNISMTGPYYHDGRVATLAEAIDRMAWMQLGRKLDNGQINVVMRFLTALADTQRSTDVPVVKAGPARPWAPPKFATLKDDPRTEEIRYGYALLSDTYAYLGEHGLGYSGNKLACGSCHQEVGTKPYGLSWMGVAKRYPRWRGRDGRESTLEDRINGCMQRSLAGKPLPKDSREMRAMVAYMTWLTEATPQENQGMLLVKFPLPDRAANPEAGKEIYALQCQNCHGAAGQGYQSMAAKDGGSYAAPPLWGNDSFNIGAGMHRLLTATPFIHANMPLGVRYNAPALSIEEAYDVAAFMDSHPRPGMENLEADWPDKAQKSIDAPYGPYADTFPATQHKYGPFKPIDQWRKEHAK